MWNVKLKNTIHSIRKTPSTCVSHEYKNETSAGKTENIVNQVLKIRNILTFGVYM